ncbi:MAG: hypothetical protein M1549_02225 [Candidatus Dependentiae bacterium]|nr:hypothetical protein [Candidatus Dependentiae bacterium]
MKNGACAPLDQITGNRIPDASGNNEKKSPRTWFGGRYPNVKMGASKNSLRRTKDAGALLGSEAGGHA